MEENDVTAEKALAVVGDLVLPPQLPQEIDPFNGCILALGVLLDKPATDQGGETADDDFGLYWQSRDWREAEQANLKILDKYLPPETRTPFFRFLLEYRLALSPTLAERKDKGEITLLQWLKALNAGAQFLFEQAKQHVAQLNENLNRAKAQDDALLTAVAIGLGAAATTALAVVNTYENYRIANAQSAMQMQALQAQSPIQCAYTQPGGYRSWGYVYCR